MPEEWRPIPGFERYEASNLGRIRSLKHASPRVLSTRVPPSARYLRVRIAGESRDVHGLVALAWLGPRPEGMEVCHNNGDGSDCRLINLRYDTRKGNSADKVRHGTAPRGEGAPNVKLTDRAVREIRNLAGHQTQRSLAARYGVSRTLIRRVITGIAWPHINPA